MLVEIRRVWKDNDEVYGARKVWCQLNREGIAVARCTVERLMRAAGLVGCSAGWRSAPYDPSRPPRRPAG